MSDKKNLPELPTVPQIPKGLGKKSDIFKQLGKGGSVDLEKKEEKGAVEEKKGPDSFKDFFVKKADAIAKKLIYLCIVMDTSASQGPWIKDMQQKVLQLIADMCKEYGADHLYIAVVEYKDYLNRKRGPYDMKVTSFTAEAGVIEKHINSIKAGPSNDSEDEMMECALYAMNELKWPDTDGAINLAVLMADAPPHTPDNCEKKRDYRKEVMKAAEKGIKIYGLVCQTGSTINFSKLDEAAKETGAKFSDFSSVNCIFSWMGVMTGGKATKIADPETVTTAIKTAVHKEYGKTKAQTVNLLTDGGRKPLKASEVKLLERFYDDENGKK